MSAKIDSKNVTANVKEPSGAIYRTLFDYAADTMFMLDNRGFVKLINKRGKDTLGYDTKDFAARKLDFIILKPYRNVFIQTLKESLKREVETVSVDVQTKSGKILNMELDVTSVKERGKYLYTQAHFRDVSRRKKAEDEIRYLNEYLETILGNLACYLRVVNPKGSVVYVNKPYKNKYGDSTGQKCYRLWNRKYPCENCIAEKAVKFNTIQMQEETLPGGDIYEKMVIPFRNRDGTVSVVEIITDVTEARRLERQEKVISNIIQMATSDIDIRNVYKTVAGKLHELVQFDRAAIVVLKEDGAHIEIFSLWSGYEQTSIDVGVYPLRGTVSEEVFKNRKPVLIDDVVESKFWTLTKLAKEGIRTFLAIPLLYKGKCIGAVTVSSKKNKAFTEKDMNILETVAPHLAIAVANTNLFIQTVEKQEELKALNSLIMRQNARLEEINRTLEDKVRERTKYLEDYIKALDSSLKIMEHFAHLELTEGKIYGLIARELLALKPHDGKYSHMLTLFCKKGSPVLAGQMLFSKKGEIVTHPDTIELEDFDQVVMNQKIKDTYYFNSTKLTDNKGKSGSKPPQFNKAIREKVGKIKNGVLCKIKDVSGNVGVVVVFNTDREVGEYDTKILSSYCVTLAFLKSINDKIQELKETYDKTLTLISNAVELRDAVTAAHTERVKQYSIEIGMKLGYKDNELVHLKWGAILHDIGKLGVPDNILMKKDALTDDEIETVKKHTTIGAKFIETLDFLKKAKDASMYHHEHYDGSGYPKGLKGEQIPMDARIVALADVYDAMTSQRPYRKAVSEEEVDTMIKENAGSQFDPQIVKAFFEIKDKIMEIRKKYIG